MRKKIWYKKSRKTLWKYYEGAHTKIKHYKNGNEHKYYTKVGSYRNVKKW